MEVPANLQAHPDMCPSSPPPDAVWTLERILQNPPPAPKRRNHPHPHRPPPRHRRSLSNIPDELLSAWPSGSLDDEDMDASDEDNSSSSPSPPALWSSTSSGSFSPPPSSSASPPLSPTCLRAALHPHRPSARSVADPRLLFQYHSTSQLYVRPAQHARKHSRTNHNEASSLLLLSSSSSNSNSNSAVLFMNSNNTSQHHPGEMWEEDRQGSTRHLFERTGSCWTRGPADDSGTSDNCDDDSRTS
jgi:hypothetical protein